MTLGTELKRIKTSSINPDEDVLMHFCHHDDVLQCYMFLLFHHLVGISVGVKGDSKIFPNWAKFVNLDSDKGTDSKVSSKFREVWKKMYEIAGKYINQMEAQDSEHIDKETYIKYCINEMSEAMSTHGWKKRGVQDLADANLSPQVSAKKLCMRNISIIVILYLT